MPLIVWEWLTRLKILTVVLVLSVGLLHLDNVLGDESPSCQSHTICVHLGDYLKYEIILGQTNSSETYYFGDMMGPNDIKVNETYFSKTSIQNTALILNLKTGFGHNIKDNSTTIPFLVILPIPIQYNQSDVSISTESKNFNGFNRTAIAAMRPSNSGTLFMEFDAQTGVLIDAHSFEITNQSTSPTILYSYVLIDTNMINSDSVKNTVSIPVWIKNTAGWWASGAVDDNSFVKAIQYLISNNIMQIPHGHSGSNTSQGIPAWIKNSAKWWAEGKISDNDFITGIQYLINSGIVQV